MGASALACGDSAPDNDGPRQAETCPTPDKPYLNPQIEDCNRRFGPPRITDLNITPFGGKVTLTVDFDITVAVDFPEMREDVRIIWDVDGEPGQDIVSDPEDEVNWQYTDCVQTQTRVRAEWVSEDGFIVKTSPDVTNNLPLTCNRPPLIDFFTATIDGQPGLIGNPDTTVQFVFEAFDPDRETNDNDGIKNFAIDFEGDGVFDVERDGTEKGIPRATRYGRPGAFRPILRVCDFNNDCTVASIGPISIFAETQTRGKVRLAAPAVAVAPMAATQSERAAFAWSGVGAGLLTRTPGASPWIPAVAQPAGGFLADVTAAPAHAFGADENLGIVAMPLTAPAPGVLADAAACEVPPSRARQVAWFGETQQGPMLAAAARTGGDVWLYYPGALTAADAACASLAASPRVQLNRSHGTFGDGFHIGEPVARDGWLLAPVTALGADGDAYGIAAYALAATDPVADCVRSGGACWTSAQPVRASALAPPRPWRQPLRDPVTDTSAETATFQLARYAVTAATATVWVDGTSVPSGPDTWTLADDETLVADLDWYQSVAADPVTLQASAQGLLALATQGGAVTVATFDPAATVAEMTIRAEAQTPGADGLRVSGRRLLRVDASSPYVPAAADALARQRRGIYVAVPTMPQQWRRLVASDHARRDVDTYPGPRDAAFAANGAAVWVADGAHGLWRAPLTDGAAVVTGAVTDRLRVDGKIRELDADTAVEQLFVALAEGLMGVDGTDPERPHPQWFVPVTAPIVDLEVLPGPDGMQALLALALRHEIQVRGAAAPERMRARFVHPATVDVVGLDSELAPGDEAYAYLLQTKEDLDTFRVVYDVQGLDAQFAPVTGLTLRVPDAFDADPELQRFAAVFGRLTPGDPVDEPRIVFGTAPEAGAFCIEPLFGAPCPGDGVLTIVQTRSQMFKTRVAGETHVFGFNNQNRRFRVFNQDGDQQSDYSLCADLPDEGEARLNCQQSLSNIQAFRAADPFVLISTGEAFYTVDVRDPTRPSLVDRQQGLGGPAAAWIVQPDLRTAVRDGTRSVQIVDVLSLFGDSN